MTVFTLELQYPVVMSFSYTIAAVVHKHHLMVRVTDVTFYLTLNHLFNRTSFPHIMTAKCKNTICVTFSWYL